ncbi:MAG: 3-dehydroquinate synthase [Flavipsychrobacter sp.]
MQYSVSFPTGTVQYHFNSSFAAVNELIDIKQCIIITDSNVYEQYHTLFQPFKAVITIPAGEQSKDLTTITSITDQLIAHKAHRKTFLLGVGGGVVTDITGFIASIYMRGVPFGFAPTSLLAMVDASVGGKNGINYHTHKNLLGCINQPQFLLYDARFLDTLPQEEWSNGFAEIIKYGCLFDQPLFEELATNNLSYYQQDKTALSYIINKCVDWKNKIVQADEQEKGTRKLLNFGHTAGHAIESIYQLPHGQAVALGMLVASIISEKNAAPLNETISRTLTNYLLPTSRTIDIDKVLAALTMDKKSNGDTIDFVLLHSIGKAYIQPLSLTEIKEGLSAFSSY